MKVTGKTDSKTKIGTGHANAMLRQGFKELQSTLYTGSNVAREAETGTFGSPTQSEIVAAKGAEKQGSVLERHAHDARAQSRSVQSRNRDAPSIEPPEPELS